MTEARIREVGRAALERPAGTEGDASVHPACVGDDERRPLAPPGIRDAALVQETA